MRGILFLPESLINLILSPAHNGNSATGGGKRFVSKTGKEKKEREKKKVITSSSAIGKLFAPSSSPTAYRPGVTRRTARKEKKREKEEGGRVSSSLNYSGIRANFVFLLQSAPCDGLGKGKDRRRSRLRHPRTHRKSPGEKKEKSRHESISFNQIKILRRHIRNGSGEKKGRGRKEKKVGCSSRVRRITTPLVISESSVIVCEPESRRGKKIHKRCCFQGRPQTTFLVRSIKSSWQIVPLKKGGRASVKKEKRRTCLAREVQENSKHQQGIRLRGEIISKGGNYTKGGGGSSKSIASYGVIHQKCLTWQKGRCVEKKREGWREQPPLQLVIEVRMRSIFKRQSLVQDMERKKRKGGGGKSGTVTPFPFPASQTTGPRTAAGEQKKTGYVVAIKASSVPTPRHYTFRSSKRREFRKKREEEGKKESSPPSSPLSVVKSAKA